MILICWLRIHCEINLYVYFINRKKPPHTSPVKSRLTHPPSAFEASVHMNIHSFIEPGCSQDTCSHQQQTLHQFHPTPHSIRNIVLFHKVHSLMYISKRIWCMWLWIYVYIFKTYMATCRVHNNTRGNIYICYAGVVDIVVFPTTLYIL